MLMGLHHVQLAMPKGGEADARGFYCGVLKMAEMPRPAGMKDDGGCWFEAGSVRVHLAAASGFTPGKDAHPGFMVASLSVVRDKLDAAGVAFEADADLPGMRRVFITDPFGNQLELLELGD